MNSEAIHYCECADMSAHGDGDNSKRGGRTEDNRRRHEAGIQCRRAIVLGNSWGKGDRRGVPVIGGFWRVLPLLNRPKDSKRRHDAAKKRSMKVRGHEKKSKRLLC